MLADFEGSKSPFWRAVAFRLSTPRNKRVIINLSRLSVLASDGFTIVVPGKVLGTGNMTEKTRVAAFSFSETAAEKIKKAGGTALTLEALFKEDPIGKKVKMVI
jgi:large subunit ribosomal protein L18e